MLGGEVLPPEAHHTSGYQAREHLDWLERYLEDRRFRLGRPCPQLATGYLLWDLGLLAAGDVQQQEVQQPLAASLRVFGRRKVVSTSGDLAFSSTNSWWASLHSRSACFACPLQIVCQDQTERGTYRKIKVGTPQFPAQMTKVRSFVHIRSQRFQEAKDLISKLLCKQPGQVYGRC